MKKKTSQNRGNAKSALRKYNVVVKMTTIGKTKIRAHNKQAVLEMVKKLLENNSINQVDSIITADIRREAV